MKLSIITINYNNKEGLQKTIDSVVSQTWRDFEWIVIDGGSTDGSKELIEQYQQHFAYWCSEPDKGIYNAMNKGIDHAQGEYLNFMNSGDCFHDVNSLSYFAKYYNPSVDVFYGDADYYDKNGILFLHQSFPDKIDDDFYISGRNINHQSSFIKASIFDLHPYDETYQVAADGDLFFWLLLRRYKFVHINKVLILGDIPGLSADIELAKQEVNRFKRENLKRLPLNYKINRFIKSTRFISKAYNLLWEPLRKTIYIGK